MVAIPEGDNGGNTNVLLPAQSGAILLTQFEPGLVSGAVSVRFSGPSLEWRLNYQSSGEVSAVATATSPLCPDIIPTLNCVSVNQDQSFRAHLSYTATADVSIPIGPANYFAPGSADRGQPRRFFGGEIVPFEVNFSGNEMTWAIGTEAISMSRNSPLCTPNTPPICNAGQPQAVACQGYVTNLILDGLGSIDPNGTNLSYAWQVNCSNSAINNPNAAQAILSLQDPGLGLAVNCSATLTVGDGLAESSCSTTIQSSACDVDCLSQPNGGTVRDVCGVCGGDGTSCLGCDGIPNSGILVDRCGICGGNDACVDCGGVPNGPAQLDGCGICQGDGTSCLPCTRTNIAQFLNSLSISLLQLRDLEKAGLAILKRQLKATPQVSALEVKRLLKQSKAFVKRHDFRYQQLQVEFFAALPPTVVTCTNAAHCVIVDNRPIVNNFNRLARQMLKTTRWALQKQSYQTARDLKRNKKARKLTAVIRRALKHVPSFASDCS